MKRCMDFSMHYVYSISNILLLSLTNLRQWNYGHYDADNKPGNFMKSVYDRIAISGCFVVAIVSF